MLKLESERLIITQFDMSMAQAVHINSLDEDNRRFVPDEVFETLEDAKDTVSFLISCYGTEEGPFVYPILLKTGENIGCVELCAIEDGWEIGYHIAKQYTKNGYASEAVRTFLPYITKEMKIGSVWGICVSQNIASRKVLERSGFVKRFEGIGMYQGEERPICRYEYTKNGAAI